MNKLLPLPLWYKLSKINRIFNLYTHIPVRSGFRLSYSIYFLLIFAFLLGVNQEAFATHSAGGYLSYQWLGRQ